MRKVASIGLVAALLACGKGAPDPRPTPAPAPPARVHGRLVVNGEPRSDYRVLVRHDPWIGTPPRTRTLRDGSFEFTDVQAGVIWLDVETPEGFAAFTRTPRFDVAAGADRTVDIEREAGDVAGELTGAVGDAEEQRVVLSCDTTSDLGDVGRLRVDVGGRVTMPDRSGRFACGPLVTGRYTLDVRAVVRSEPWGQRLVANLTTVTVEKGRTTTLPPIEVLPQFKVSGHFELPENARLAAIIRRNGIWLARVPRGSDVSTPSIHLALDNSFSIRLLPGTYEVGTLGIDDEPHAHADPLVVPPGGVSNAVIVLHADSK